MKAENLHRFLFVVARSKIAVAPLHYGAITILLLPVQDSVEIICNELFQHASSGIWADSPFSAKGS